MDIPRIFNITESAHRIHNPFTPDKYATLGAAVRLSAGALPAPSRCWRKANPHDELANEVRALLTTEPVRHATCTRQYLGWGVFALMAR